MPQSRGEALATPAEPGPRPDASPAGPTPRAAPEQATPAGTTATRSRRPQSDEAPQREARRGVSWSSTAGRSSLRAQQASADRSARRPAQPILPPAATRTSPSAAAPRPSRDRRPPSVEGSFRLHAALATSSCATLARRRARFDRRTPPSPAYRPTGCVPNAAPRERPRPPASRPLAPRRAGARGRWRARYVGGGRGSPARRAVRPRPARPSQT